MRQSRASPTMALGSCLLALSLAACRDEDRSAASPPPVVATDSGGFAYAEPVLIRARSPEEGYRWGERAYGLQRAFRETPPDYRFDDGGHDTWVWRTADDWAMYAEPYDDDYRYYYYEPGADYPYFVRDDRYGYGFGDGGALVALFDASGDYLPQERFYEAAPLASGYYVHGRSLRIVSHRAPRLAVDEDQWRTRAPRLTASSDAWIRAANDRRWRSWRERSGEAELRRFAPEERRRHDARGAFRAAWDGPVYPGGGPEARPGHKPHRESVKEMRRAEFQRVSPEARRGRDERGSSRFAWSEPVYPGPRSDPRPDQRRAFHDSAKDLRQAERRQTHQMARAEQGAGPERGRPGPDRVERKVARGPDHSARPARREDRPWAEAHGQPASFVERPHGGPKHGQGGGGPKPQFAAAPGDGGGHNPHGGRPEQGHGAKAGGQPHGGQGKHGDGKHGGDRD